MQKKGINKHYEKVNIRFLNLFENSKLDIRIIYFIIFFNFIERYSINQAYNNCKEFSNQLKIETVSRKGISKKYNLIRTKIMKTIFAKWKSQKMGLEPCVS